MTGEDRTHELLYSCDSREELCERITELEDIVRCLWISCIVDQDDCATCCQRNVSVDGGCALYARAKALGVMR